MLISIYLGWAYNWGNPPYIILASSLINKLKIITTLATVFIKKFARCV